MDYFSMPYQWLLTSLATLIVFVFIWSITAGKTSTTSNKAKKAPPIAAGAWPIIGHLHLIMGGELPHRLLSNLADKYGPIFMLNYGSQPGLVVSSLKLAKECFVHNDRAVFKRPNSKAMKYFTYDQASFGFAPYGPLWVEMRKVSKSNLLSNQRLQLQRNQRASEVDAFIKELYQLCKKSNNGTLMVEMNKWFEELTLNVVTRMVCGKKNIGAKARHGGDNEAKYYKKVIDEATIFTAKLVASDFFPSLGWVDYLHGDESAIKQTAKELDSIIGSWVEEHRQKRLLSLNKDDYAEQDFIDITLSMIDQTQHQGIDADTFVKSMCVGMIFGGSDSTSVALNWALSILMNNRHVLKRAREEIDTLVGKDRKVNDVDVTKLVYLKAIVKESMRLCLVGPLLERVTVEDCEIGGFYVKAGSRIVVNIWKLQHDPDLWSDDVMEFRPERFLTTNSNVELRGQHFELIPFGSGSRMCPGVTFALELMHLTLARLIHGFELGTPMDAKVDMTETSSVTNYKATPLEILLTPRLHPKLYDF